MTANKKSKVFISYAHDDEKIATKILESLKDAGMDTWIDVEEINWGDSFLEKMNQGLASADYVILLLSPAANASRWVQREWMSALTDQGKVVLPVLVADTPVPPLLKDLVYIDLRSQIDEGLQKIVSFFAAEHSPIDREELKSRFADSGRIHPLRKAPRKIVRLVAHHCLHEHHFLDFLFDIDIPESQIPGNSLKEKLTRLLTDLHAAGISSEFVDWVLFEPDKLLRTCIDNQIKQLTEN